MADNKKIYTIQINGIQESTNAVEALNKQLDNLEKRINTLQAKSVNINTSGGGSTRTSNASAMSEEEKLTKQIEQIDAKRVAYSKEIYQNYLAAKDVLSETVNDQKQISAQERLQANQYAKNTMAGMKQELADLKAVMNSTDLGDEAFGKMSQRASELTNKLKELEQSYGQFGRNVGNYANGVAAGLQKVVVMVGDVPRSFDNAKQAAKTLGNELKTMAVNGQQDTKAFQDLQEAVAKLNSEIKDATVSSKAMDNLLDTMQSFAAIGTISTGFSSLFGIDNTEVEQSIKKMVAFQNVLKGIETINKQIQTREGVGAWIAPFTKQIDKATAKLLTFNTALLGTGKAAKVAAVGIKTLGVALKSLMTLGIVAIISVAIEKIMDLIESFNKLSDAEQAQKDAEEAMADAYGKGMAKLTQYKSKLDAFNGSKKEEKQLVEELNKEFGETLGTYKSVAEWQDVLKTKGEAYIKTLQLQAKAQAIVNSLTAAYAKLQQIDFAKASGEYDTFLNKMMNFVGLGKIFDEDKKEAQDFINFLSTSLEDVNKEIEKNNKDNKLGNYAPQIKKNTTKTKNALEESQKTLTQLELRLMKDGLNKKLRQLDEEERQTINKLKENGRKNSEEIQKIQRAYAALRAKEIQDYLRNLDESIKKTSKELKKTRFEINIKDIDNQLDELKLKFDELAEDIPANNTLTSRVDLRQVVGNSTLEGRLYANEFNEKKLEAEATGNYDKFYSFLKTYLKGKNKEIKEEFSNLFTNVGEEQAYSELANHFEEEFKDALNAVRSYGSEVLSYTNDFIKDSEDMLLVSFNHRTLAARMYYKNTIQDLVSNIKEQEELSKQKANEQYELDIEEERERYRLQYNALEKQREIQEEAYNAISDTEVEAKKKAKEQLDKIDKQLEEALEQHGEKMGQITEANTNTIKTIETNSLNDISSAYEKYFSLQLSNYSDFQSKLNNEISRNPITDKAGFGIVNIAATKKNYNEIIKASQDTLDEIKNDKKELDRLYNGGFIKPEVYNATIRQLNDVENEIKVGMAITAENSKQLIGDFIASINQYVQVIGQSVQQVMQAVWDYQDYMFEKEQEELDKWNEKLDKALDEQQEIIEEHKNNIDSIEDELANARGGRREHLIDQLNAEIEAQREAQREEKRIQKEKEQAEKKQEALDKKRRKEEYDRNVMQAFVNWHLAIMNGLATQPFLYMGIAMGAVATALGAVQYALIKSQKPYAKGGQLDGGVAQGNRHRDGGIPVLGGRASIEGGEFITNRQTTAKNVDLLEYINSKKKKIDISDLMEFYSTTPRKTIKGVRTKFEDGGYLPTMPNELDIKDQLQNIVVNQDNRPIYVSVVDINNKQDDVRRVQTLAGL